MTSAPADSSAALQLALDMVSLNEARTLTRLLSPQLRRVEIGTPLVLVAGLDAVRQIRTAAATPLVLTAGLDSVQLVQTAATEPVTVVADVKVCDAGERIARAAFAAGADIVTVVAAAIDDITWDGVLEAAAGRSAPSGAPAVVLDSIGLPASAAVLAEQAARARAHGVPVELCIHRPKVDPPSFDALAAPVRDLGFATLSAAGKLSAADVSAAIDAGFDTLIVGGAVAGATDPALSWSEFVSEAGRARA